MVKKILIAGAVVAVAVVGIAYAYRFQTHRMTPERLREMAEAETRVNQAQSQEMLLAQADGEASKEPFQVKFHTTAGDILIRVNPEWAPLAAQRFRQLVDIGFYDNAAFFRVIPGFVNQFGMAADPQLTAQWQSRNLQDEAPRESNKRGTLAFAKSQLPNSRSTQVFFNVADNNGSSPMTSNLDAMGFAPFAEVVSGMDVVDTINATGVEADQGTLARAGNAYLKQAYPNMYYIESATIVEEPEKAPEEAPAPAPDAAAATPPAPADAPATEPAP